MFNLIRRGEYPFLNLFAWVQSSNYQQRGGGGGAQGIYFSGEGRAQCFIGGGKAAHFFREGVNLVHIMVIKGTYFESAQKRYLPSDHFLTIWQQIQSQQV